MEKITAKLGAVLYVCWGLLHFTAAYGVYRLAQNSPATMAQGRLMQTAFYLTAFAATAIVLALTLNWRNDRLGFWVERDHGRHRRHSFHSVCLDPRIRAVVAGPAWSGALDCGLFSHKPRPDRRCKVCCDGIRECCPSNLIPGHQAVMETVGGLLLIDGLGLIGYALERVLGPC